MSEIAALKVRQRAAATKALEAWMDGVLGASQQIVPLDEATLAGSADRDTHAAGNIATVEGYYSEPYAARQHEELGYAHRAGREAKYLERPFKERLPSLERFVAKAVDAVTPG